MRGGKQKCHSQKSNDFIANSRKGLKLVDYLPCTFVGERCTLAHSLSYCMYIILHTPCNAMHETNIIVDSTAEKIAYLNTYLVCDVYLFIF